MAGQGARRNTMLCFILAAVALHMVSGVHLDDTEAVQLLDVTLNSAAGGGDEIAALAGAAQGLDLIQELATTGLGNATAFSDCGGKCKMVDADPLLPPIITPSLKNQVVTKMRLPNGIGVYIVSDEALESSAMGVGVEVGSWSDPDDALGMAHFVEHMMFMGTKQHPKPGNFDEFLAANGAQISNAATGSSSTCYAFSTPHEAFKAGIERFSEFFTDPLFDSKGAAKEMHAVNQEFEMHKDEDGYRQYMISKELSNPKHPTSRFSIGNLDTLSKIQNARLVKWWKEHYSANLMHVAVFTALPTKEVQDLIASKFARVPNHQYKRLTMSIPTLREDLDRKEVHTKPERDVRSVSLSWELPTWYAHKRTSRPDRMVAAVLGDEGPGSLTARLREQHLALSMSAGMGTVGRDNAVFSVELSLTEKGMKMRDAVIGMVFKAIHGVRSKGVPKYFWEEAQLRDRTSWETQERTADTFNAAMSEVRAMFDEPLETYPRTQSILSEYDPDGIVDILRALHPDRMHLEQMGGEFPPKNMVGKVRTEPYYKAKFAVAATPADVIAEWTKIAGGAASDSIEAFWPKDDEYELPKPNTYLVKEPHVSEVDPKTPVFPALPQPKLVVNNTFGRLYVGTDKAFGDPFISASIQIKTPAAITKKHGPKAEIMTNLFVDCVSESLKSSLYPFETAGLGASLSQGKGTNLYVTVSGKVPVKATYMALLEQVLKPMKQNFEEYTSKDTFAMIKKAVTRFYKNDLKSGARATASRTLWNTFSNTRTPVEEKLAIIEKVTYEEVQAFIPELFEKFSFEGFIYGQVTEPDAVAVYQAVQATLRGDDAATAAAATATASGTTLLLGESAANSSTSSSSALTEAEEFVSEMRVLPADQGPWYLPVSGSARSNATIILIDGGHLPCDEAMALPVLYKEVGNMFFKQLRTKQQTGYVASSYATTVARRTVVLMLVESSWAGPGDLVKRFEAFNEMVLKGVNDGTVMPEKKLESIKSSMLSSFDKPIQNIGGMAGILQGIIKDYDGDFDAEKKKKVILEKLTRETIVKVANAVLGPQNKRRFAVLYSPKGVPTDPVPKPYTLFKDAGKFEPKPKYKCDVCITDKCTKRSVAADLTAASQHQEAIQANITKKAEAKVARLTNGTRNEELDQLFDMLA